MSANLLGLLKSAASESSLLGKLGRWRQEISRAVDDILNGVAGVTDEGFPYLFQTSWAVDSVAGSDSNPGTPPEHVSVEK